MMHLSLVCKNDIEQFGLVVDTQDEICNILTLLETKFDQDKLEEVYDALFSRVSVHGYQGHCDGQGGA